MKKKQLKYIVLLLILLGILSLNTPPQKLFVIGDSISIFYGPYLKKYLNGIYEYDRKRDKGEAMINLDNPIGANGGDSRMVVTYMKELLTEKSFHSDVLLINCGLHDIKTTPGTGEKQISIDEYRKNLNEIYKLAKKLNAKLIWINCTPVNDSIHNSKGVAFYRYNKDVIAYNHVSDSIFRSKKTPIIDLYSFSSKFPIEAYKDHVHYTNEYAKLQASYIAGFLSNIKK